MSKRKCYSELIKLPTFEERFAYLQLNGIVGSDTFGHDRYLNQVFYKSSEWKKARDAVILRDSGCDLGIEGLTIFDKILIHHMNPITREDIQNRNHDIFDPEYLICVSYKTHNAIHYGGEDPYEELIERRPGDTCLWRKHE